MVQQKYRKNNQHSSLGGRESSLPFHKKIHSVGCTLVLLLLYRQDQTSSSQPPNPTKINGYVNIKTWFSPPDWNTYIKGRAPELALYLFIKIHSIGWTLVLLLFYRQDQTSSSQPPNPTSINGYVNIKTWFSPPDWITYIKWRAPELALYLICSHDQCVRLVCRALYMVSEPLRSLRSHVLLIRRCSIGEACNM